MASAFESFAVRLDVVQQAAEGLAYLHSLTPAVLHRDMKPDNIMVQYVPSGWSPVSSSSLASSSSSASASSTSSSCCCMLMLMHGDAR